MGRLPLSAREARAAGHSRYFTGKPCVAGHIAERITNSGTCVVCHGQRRRRWQDAHKAEVNAARKAWRKQDHVRQAERAYKHEWNRRNPERLRRMKAASYQRCKARTASCASA